MYLVWLNTPINFTFSDDSVFLKKILAGDINSLNLLVVVTVSVKKIAKKTKMQKSYIFICSLYNMSRVMRHASGICENKGADQLRSNCAAD